MVHEDPDQNPDLTTKARIRDAAVAVIAQHGLADTTTRKIAEAAGVSPGLVIHHFGSMDGLRRACDEYAAARIRELKEDAAAQGAGMDVIGAVRESDVGYLLPYLAAVLVDDSPAVAELIDDMVADAEEYSERMVETGMLRPTEYPRERAALLVVWSLGSLVLHTHMERLLGVDLTDPELTSSSAFARYALPVYEIYGGGVMTEEFAASAKEAFSRMAGDAGPAGDAAGRDAVPENESGTSEEEDA